ncbi:hypothetical protein PHMEG_0008285 [Phytophthora megakarya]|uniref:Integrase catalytic domain-containing protein n=1 Tax=Phytophthora megakarya TaxID=4795 RepID=A0A225WJJ8_9STRA|nr:hypothetical protein PHMEG_0008285 [Phytophthora megakarya]
MQEPRARHQLGRNPDVPEANGKVLNLPFSKTQKGIQSFLGSLNYYAKFIEDLPVLAATLYEASGEQLRSGRDLEKPKHAFKILKDRLVSTPLLQHPDLWRLIQDAVLRYHPAEKEVSALLRVLNTCHTMIISCSEKVIRVYTRYSVLEWLFKSKTNDKDGLAAILGAGITPPERLDEVAETLDPEKGSRIKTGPVSLEMLSSDHIGHLLSFDGAAKRDGSGGAACILWSLPNWEIVAATGHFLEKATSLVEYAFLATAQNIPKCYPRGLAGDVFAVTCLKSKHVKATEKSVPGTGIDDSETNESGTDSPGTNDLRTNASGTEGPGTNDLGANGSGTDGLEDEPTAASRRPDCQDSEEDPEDVRRERWRRICSHQTHDSGLAPLVKFLRGETEHLSLKQTTHLAKIADQFVLDSPDALFYVSRNTPERPRDAADRLRLVVPRDLQEDILYHCHGDFQGPSPGNLLATRPFQCAFSGFVMCKAMASTEAQDVSEVYEEFVFQRFGASEMIRHDRDPRFMGRVFKHFQEMLGRVFKHFQEMLGSRQRATLAYRPLANGQQERSVQTVIQSVKVYVQTVDQSGWDELAEELMWAQNTSFDFTRLDTPFYLVHGWDAQGTVEAMM